MYSLDTEDDSRGNVFIINFYNGVSHATFTGPDLKVKAWDFLNSIAPETIWATNLEYDLLNLFGSEWLGKIVTLQYVSAGIMRAFFKESKIIFFDTLRHWQYTVEQMGKFLKLPKLTPPHLGCSCVKCIEYCRRDSEITWRFVEEMLFRYETLGLKIRSTLPAMAMQLFKKFWGSDFFEFPDGILEKFKEGYFGGRVEVYKYNVEVKGPIYHYDFNSLFPSVMVESKFPDLETWKLTIKPDFDQEGLFKGFVSVPSSNIPCLPVRVNNEIIFPVGSFFGSWTYPEIRQLLEDGGQARAVECIEFSRSINPFNSYVNFCYPKRLASTSDLDKLFWKLMLNSLYGKFAQLEGITTIHTSRKTGEVVEEEIGGRSKQSNVIWSAYVTAYGRLKLLVALRNCSKVYYTDTDSIFTPDKLAVSDQLGDLKLEGVYSSALFRGNKLYIVDDKARAKGVRQSVAKDFIRTGRAVFRRPARFKESRRTFAKANVWYTVEKRLEKEYTKRKVIHNGETTPWNYLEYMKIHG